MWFKKQNLGEGGDYGQFKNHNCNAVRCGRRSAFRSRGVRDLHALVLLAGTEKISLFVSFKRKSIQSQRRTDNDTTSAETSA